MHQPDPARRATGLKQAQTYFEYIIPYEIEGWSENDVMMQVARLYEITPPGKGKDGKESVREAKQAKHMAKEAYKDIFKAARAENVKSRNPAIAFRELLPLSCARSLP